MHENGIGRIIVDAALAIHRELGPGLLESVYEAVLAQELSRRGLSIARQVSVPIEYAGLHFDEAFRADIIVERSVILALKSVKTLKNISKKQLLTYLRLSGLKLGFVIHFGEALIKNGIIRIVNGLSEN